MTEKHATRDSLAADERLRVTEIFHSIQGESRPSGCPTVFVRLTGCPLRCGYCDTEYAFQGGSWYTIDRIVADVQVYATEYVCVTGGEPLAQENCRRLLTALCDAGFKVSLETSGVMDISGLDERVSVVMDLKTPRSGEQAHNLMDNIELLKSEDQLKFVICDRADYEWAKQVCDEHGLTDICSVLFSPSQPQLDAKELAEWILADKLRVRFQVQLHKYLWGNAPGH
ncbi:MAG: 7-carboxy-7-deazaguanine synthase QueE [Gammaproteobacteria bacterium]|jgi:7-carboxy-7-deazaguanine synthase|nr:7-carboxy-7-deazaguanine synthase QueE [Gammaproteobacteria bacterium]MDP6616496.1 7-carboxy-7-deazaguanine synthase QueE [Gammaproteobacteria bacterium]MDP6694255.1 7-carboxy-7-deazaguanine synthase QueE [Gammaproteobacteria bacterium]